jgi:hypothetical protein
LLNSYLVGIPAGSRVTWSHTVGTPKKVDGPKWSVPVDFRANVSVAVQGFSTSVNALVNIEVIVDVKAKTVIGMNVINSKIG